MATTHMDAQTLIIWNMGAIANRGHPGALGLFPEVILASSSISAALPPVFIEVDDDHSFDEMHTDGDTVAQVFFYKGTMDLSAAGRTKREGYRGTLYIIRNGKLGPEPEQIRRRLPEISGRALSTMIKFAAFNDLYRIYGANVATNMGFRYVAIPGEFESKADELFDPREMNRLFELGYEMGLAGTAWRDTLQHHLVGSWRFGRTFRLRPSRGMAGKGLGPNLATDLAKSRASAAWALGVIELREVID